MLDWLLILISGLLGSAHCVGMCGGFVVTIGASSPTPSANVFRQFAYGSGRVFTYSFLGAVGGFLGLRLTESIPAVARVQAILAIVAGLLLMVQGILATGLVTRRIGGNSSASCLGSSLLGPMLQAPGNRAAFLAGLFTGFLPCGLVYAFLSLAVSTAQVPLGMAIMAVFGLGTVPLMVVVGCGASALSPMLRRQVYTFAAWTVVGTGMLTVARGTGLLAVPANWLFSLGPLCGT